MESQSNTFLPAVVRTTSATRAPTTAARPGETVEPVSTIHKGPQGYLKVPSRLLMGPGPTNAHPRVLAAQSLPLLGHMHPPFFKIMDEISEGLRYMFQTTSKYTLLVSGTGHAGMEAAVVNLMEPGEKVVVADSGIWGKRASDMVERLGGSAVRIKADPGRSVALDALKAALQEHRPALLFCIQGESSTGVHQSLAGLGEACRASGTLLVVDAVASLGGVPIFADAWGIDCIYSGSQKCLSGPPGAAPFFMSEGAVHKLKSRTTKVASFNWDMNLVGDYWGWWGGRSYHHTAPISTFYAMREALAIAGEEGLEAMWGRHVSMHERLWRGLRELGLEPYVEANEDRLITVNTIKVPDGVDWAALSKLAMDEYDVEISGGLGPSAGRVWRVGLMGYNARLAAVEVVLAAFRNGLAAQGWNAPFANL